MKSWMRIWMAAGYLAAAMVPVGVGIYRPGITGYERAELEELVYGRAWRPFVKRQLVPLAVRGLTAVVPAGAKERMTAWFGGAEWTGRLKWKAEYATETVLAVGVMWVSLAGFLAALRWFLMLTAGLREGAAYWIAIAVGVTLPVTFCGKVYLYDFPQLLLFTGGLGFLYQRRWGWFYAAYVLACLNKETSVLLGVVFAVWMGRRIFARENLGHLAAMVLIGGGIAAGLAYVFRGNSGGQMEWHWGRNLAMEFTGLGWMRLAVLGLAVLVCLARWSKSAAFLRAGFLGTLPVLFGATLLWGYVDELRDYYEALPAMVGMIAGIFATKTPRHEDSTKEIKNEQSTSQ